MIKWQHKFARIVDVELQNYLSDMGWSFDDVSALLFSSRIAHPRGLPIVTRNPDIKPIIERLGFTDVKCLPVTR